MARLAMAVVSGLLLLAAFPPVGWWWSAPLGVAALLGAVRGTGYRRSWVLAAVAHLVLFLPLLEWVRFLGVGPWAALGLLEAAVAGLLGPLVVAADRVSRDQGAVRAAGLVGAFVLVGTDLTLATRFGGPVEAALAMLVLMPVDGSMRPLSQRSTPNRRHAELSSERRETTHAQGQRPRSAARRRPIARRAGAVAGGAASPRA